MLRPAGAGTRCRGCGHKFEVSDLVQHPEWETWQLRPGVAEDDASRNTCEAKPFQPKQRKHKQSSNHPPTRATIAEGKVPATKLMHQAAPTAMTINILPVICVPTTRRCRAAQTEASKFASIASTTASFADANISSTDQALPTTPRLCLEFASSNARRQNHTLMTNTCVS